MLYYILQFHVQIHSSMDSHVNYTPRTAIQCYMHDVIATVDDGHMLRAHCKNVNLVIVQSSVIPY